MVEAWCRVASRVGRVANHKTTRVVASATSGMNCSVQPDPGIPVGGQVELIALAACFQV